MGSSAFDGGFVGELCRWRCLVHGLHAVLSQRSQGLLSEGPAYLGAGQSLGLHSVQALNSIRVFLMDRFLRPVTWDLSFPAMSFSVLGPAICLPVSLGGSPERLS